MHKINIGNIVETIYSAVHCTLASWLIGNMHESANGNIGCCVLDTFERAKYIFLVTSSMLPSLPVRITAERVPCHTNMTSIEESKRR